MSRSSFWEMASSSGLRMGVCPLSCVFSCKERGDVIRAFADDTGNFRRAQAKISETSHPARDGRLTFGGTQIGKEQDHCVEPPKQMPLKLRIVHWSHLHNYANDLHSTSQYV